MVDDIDEQPPLPTLYVACPLHLPPLTAQAAFDAQRDAAYIDATAETWVVETTGTELRLVGNGAVERRGPGRPLRCAPGRLRRRAGRVSVAVEVEVVPWSDRRCQVGIRPLGRGVPMADGWRQRRYFSLAVDAAEGLAHALQSQVDDWMATKLRHPRAAANSAGLARPGTGRREPS